MFEGRPVSKIGILNGFKVFYFSDPFKIFNDDWIVDLEKINELKKHPFVVADFSLEHYGSGGIYNIYEVLEKNNLNFILLSYDPQDHLKYPRLLYYPFWYFYGILQFQLSKKYDNSRQFLWSCQNGFPRPHRVYNFLYAQKKDIIQKCIFTMHNAKESYYRKDDYPLDDEMLKQWECQRHNLPLKNTVFSNGEIGYAINTPMFCDAYVNLVTETTIIPKIFITEKTWKPIAAQQLFLIFGNPGTIAALRSMGVDTFDDIIDHGYDLEEDWKIRLEKIYDSLHALEFLDMEEVYKATESRRLNNATKCLSGEFGKIYKDALADTMEFYFK